MNFWSLAVFCAVALAGTPTNLEFYDAGYQSYWACTYAVSLEVNISAVAYDYSVFCLDQNAMATLAGCYSYKNRVTEKDTWYWVEYCTTTYLMPITFANISDAYSVLELTGVAVDELGNYTAGALPEPAWIDKSVAVAQMDAYAMFLNNYNWSVYFGAASVAYWGLIAVVSGAANWSMVLFPLLRRTLDGKVARLWRKYVTMPALMSRMKTQQPSYLTVFTWIIPSRFELLVLFGYLWFLFILCAVDIHVVQGDLIFASHKEALNRYVADRTGIITIATLPLMILFGGRNNFLLWLTRWKFATFITYHRWIARLIVLMAFIHGLCYFVEFNLYDDLAEEVAENYVVWGLVAWACGIIIMFQGLLFLRKRFYEAFLVAHIALAAFFVIGSWYHVYELGYSQFMYATFAVWAFDRLVRWTRIALFGFPKAEVTLFSDDTLRVVIRKPAHWKAVPGGHAYVYFMHLYHFWQNHPFTYVELDSHITFYCKIKGGITKYLKKHLANVPGKTCSMRVAVEGPYGEPAPVKGHSDVVLLAGGNGIPGLFSEFQALAKAADSKQKLKLKWIIREIKSYAWMCKEFAAYKDKQNVEITVFVTRPDLVEGAEELTSMLTSDNESSEKEDKTYSSDLLEQVRNEFPHVTFVEGRPNLGLIIADDIQEAAHSVAFVTCAVAPMVDEIRYQVVKNIDKTEKRLDFYEAVEIWA